MGCPPLVLQLLICGFVSLLSSSALIECSEYEIDQFFSRTTSAFVFVVSDSPIILIICVTFHCLIILLMLGALIGN